MIEPFRVSVLLPPRKVFPFSYVIPEIVTGVKPLYTLLRRAGVAVVPLTPFSGDINSPMM